MGLKLKELNVYERKRIKAVKINCLLNKEIRRKFSKKARVSERMDQSILRLFGHLERMEDGRLARKEYE